VAVAWSTFCWSASVWLFALSAELRSCEMPSSVPASVADPAGVDAAVVAAPDTDRGEAAAVLGVAGDPDSDDGEAGAVPDVAARPHPVNASATATRTAARTRGRFT
jgi:hypothetical protein